MTSDTATRARVLVVDDAATVRLYHSTLLNGAGFEVSEAANGLEAVEAALGTEFDLFVVDVNMPKMNGYACVEALRSDSVGSDAPIVMISTEDRPGDADRAYQAGANLYLVKPVAGDRLTRVATMLTAGKGGAA
ncbi:response regulator [Actinoplanes derwentensis]|uniref:Two-component system, chemotaxis family, response regulator CheY n=1 Tax=Actinoplanes derwentensis TaxID=113562 RepID=A0A1H2D620_9ACTN|nr:response regulator [Actinoplanes derwentensis]GID90371.1 response regulator [Actinoplanes derwentensis]SDT78017.1 two-component system, chemotaxis family, response regulator CheY [Actinoplanes derwentensis]